MEIYANIILTKIIDNTNTNISAGTEFFHLIFLSGIIIQKKRNKDDNFGMSSRILNTNNQIDLNFATDYSVDSVHHYFFEL